MVQDEVRFDEEMGGLPVGAMVATAIAAGVVAFMIRRARQEPHTESPADIAAAAWERAESADFRGRTIHATRDFVTDRVLPEMKPVLLDLLGDLREYTDKMFQRAEKAVKEL